MLDQILALRNKDLLAIFVSNFADKVHQDVCNGCYQIVLMSCEALLADTERRDVKLLNTYYLKDETHCVKI